MSMIKSNFENQNCSILISDLDSLQKCNKVYLFFFDIAVTDGIADVVTGDVEVSDVVDSDVVADDVFDAVVDASRAIAGNCAQAESSFLLLMLLAELTSPISFLSP